MGHLDIYNKNQIRDSSYWFLFFLSEMNRWDGEGI